MKNALILHATANNSKGNWYLWLRDELKKRGYKVWLPDLPSAERPNIERYNKFILSNKEWEFNDESIIIGHSSGSVAALGLLEEIPSKINKSILVSVFENDLGWDSLKDLFIKQLDFELIKNKSKEFVVVHSDNDPHCPLDGAVRIVERLNAKMIIKKGQGHFNLEAGEQYKKFPFLLELIP